MNKITFKNKSGRILSNIINCYIGLNSMGRFILCKNDVNHLMKVSYCLEVIIETDELTKGMETTIIKIIQINLRGFELESKNEAPEWLNEILWQHYQIIK